MTNFPGNLGNIAQFDYLNQKMVADRKAVLDFILNAFHRNLFSNHLKNQDKEHIITIIHQTFLDATEFSLRQEEAGIQQRIIQALIESNEKATSIFFTNEIGEWCKNNITDRWEKYSNPRSAGSTTIIIFKDKEAAALFKLYWG